MRREISLGIGVDTVTKNYSIYVMPNKSRTFYVRMTNNLERRIYEAKQRRMEGFTKRYNITQLVYYEVFSDVREAIAREKQVNECNGSLLHTLS